MMRTFVMMPPTHPPALPPEFRFDVRSSEPLVELLLREFTHEGDVVLDPFAGFGTTLVVAQRLGRVPFGLELNPQVRAYARTLLRRPDWLLDGDARKLASYDLPPFNLCLTSPPFMVRGDEEDPLAAYAVPGAGYEAYVEGLQGVFRQARQLMKPGAHVLLEVANLKRGDEVTALAWDIAAAVGEVLHFEGEIVVCWDRTGAYGYDHSYCLVFTKGE